MIVYVAQTINHDPKIRHLGEKDRPLDIVTEPSQSPESVDEGDDCEAWKTDHLCKKWFQTFDIQTLTDHTACSMRNPDKMPKPKEDSTAS